MNNHLPLFVQRVDGLSVTKCFENKKDPKGFPIHATFTDRKIDCRGNLQGPIAAKS
jgi:hypothetical protein